MRRLTTILMLSLPLTASAHDLWLEQDGKRLTLYQGHRHSSHAGAATLDYGKDFVVAARCFDERGTVRPLSATSRTPWSAAADCAVVQLEASSGYWSKTPWETKNVPKPEAPGALKSWLSRDSLKRIERWSARFAQPLGAGLEIVPVVDPLALKPDDKLAVRVLRDGQPVAGAMVAYHGDPRGETDADGRVAIRLRHGGIQLIATSVDLPLKDGKADTEILAATLQFEIKP